MYKIIRPLLFLFPAETAHNLTARILRLIRYIPLSGPIMRWCFKYNSKSLQREVMGLNFPNPIGLAAGMDKNGNLYNSMANLGFGFVEIGSITPKAQSGNPQPRNFRLVNDRAIINRMGINNIGVRGVVKNLQGDPPRILIGGNISKNALTENANAPLDYEKSFARLYDYVDFFVINVSCPNVEDLTKLQEVDTLSVIIDHLTQLRRYFEIYRPILLKLSPDLSTSQLDELIELTLISGLDGVVVCNTTLDRSMLTTPLPELQAIGRGGLSGAPLKEKSLSMIRYINKKTEGVLPIIGVGGVMSPQDAWDMIEAGASLVEVYSGFVYEGPSFIKRTLKFIDKKLNATSNSQPNQ